MDFLSVFNPLRFLISSLYISLSFFFSFYLSFFHSILMLYFSLPQIWLYKKLKLIHPPLVPSNWYQLKHYHDCKVKDKEMDLTKLTELLKHLIFVDIQWVVEWWCIKAMTSCGFKEKCVPLVGLHRCSYYPCAMTKVKSPKTSASFALSFHRASISMIQASYFAMLLVTLKFNLTAKGT